jgi:Leucine-rich repeat (LRR) protein/cold shock CspA family protein
MDDAIDAENRSTYTVMGQIYFGWHQVGKIKQNAFRLNQLIGEQIKLFETVSERISSASLSRGRPQCRLLIQAPSGSGKTLLCAKLAVDFVFQRVQKRIEAAQAEAHGHTDTHRHRHTDTDGTGGDVGGDVDGADGGGANCQDACTLLLVTHSNTLSESTANDIFSELKGVDWGIPMLRRSNHNSLAHADVELWSREFNDIRVRVMSVDAMTEQFGAESPKPFGMPFAAELVVDEGHVVFSHQPASWLDGQHTFKDPKHVCETVERILIPGAPVIIFRDQSYIGKSIGGQLVSCEPVYPVGCSEVAAPLPIVRNPGAVRDLSVPFSTTLSNGSRSESRAMFYPLLDEVACGGVGSVIRSGVSGLVDPSEFTVEKSYTRKFDCDAGQQFEYIRMITGKFYRRFEAECREQSRYYAIQITAALLRIQAKFATKESRSVGGCTGGDGSSDGSDSNGWWGHVAVLVPGTPVDVAQELWEATIEHALTLRTLEGDAVAAAVRAAVGSGNCEQEVERDGGGARSGKVASLPTAIATIASSPTTLPLQASAPLDERLYFGAVENFAGLERPFVVATGMQHPRYLAHRLTSEPDGSWGTCANRVDPRMYLAITRCTYELSVVEIDAQQYALHFKMSDVLKQKMGSSTDGGHDGMVELWGTNITSEQVSRACVELESSSTGHGGVGMRSLRITVIVDLAAPPPPETLKTATSIRMKLGGLTPDVWRKTTFRWDQCECGITELSLEGAAPVSGRPFEDYRAETRALCGVRWAPRNHRHGNKPDPPHGAAARSAEHLAIKTPYRPYGDATRAGAPPYVPVARSVYRGANGDRSPSVGVAPSAPAEAGAGGAPATQELLFGQMQVQTLTQLQVLTIDMNQLTAVPKEIGNLTELKRLCVTHNRLTSVPSSLGNLVLLTELRLGQNKLQGLPCELGNLTLLERLQLTENELTELPDSLGNLTQLKELRLGINLLKAVPETFGNLTQLTELHLRSNQLTAFPHWIVNLTKLEALALQRNELEELPQEIGSLVQLRSLTLDDNKLKAVPQSLGMLTRLTVLKICSNHLTNLPIEIGNLAQLRVFRLRHNQLTSVPAEIGNLAQLTELVIGNNCLTAVPDELGNLTQLTQLHLSNNKLTTVPRTFGNLTQLMELGLSYNCLTSVPSELGKLAQLKQLHLGNNKLTTVPRTFGNLTQLNVLHLNNNADLTVVPIEIVRLRPRLRVLSLWRERGTVKNWFGDRGYGFITQGTGFWKPGLYCHVSNVKDGAHLEGGNVVEYSVAHCENKGYSAIDVRVFGLPNQICKPCCYYQRGACNRGQLCRFSHEQSGGGGHSGDRDGRRNARW